MATANMKKIKTSYAVEKRHWVGDGFFVHGLLRPSKELSRYISPFVLLDYASPADFTPTAQQRGVGQHPHRGFETVTFAYQGAVQHRDSTGGGGVIEPGDVQWMTAGRGIVHDEFHSKEFSKTGGTFEMVQLWVNLPQKHKMTKPKYQDIQSKTIPTVELGDNARLRVVAGSFQDVIGPASTYTPIKIYEVECHAAKSISLDFTAQSNTVLLIMQGELEIENTKYQA